MILISKISEFKKKIIKNILTSLIDSAEEKIKNKNYDEAGSLIKYAYGLNTFGNYNDMNKKIERVSEDYLMKREIYS